MSLWGREHGEVAVGMSTRWPAEGICLGLLFSLDRSGFHCSYKLVPYAFDSLLTLPVMADLTTGKWWGCICPSLGATSG